MTCGPAPAPAPTAYRCGALTAGAPGCVGPVRAGAGGGVVCVVPPVVVVVVVVVCVPVMGGAGVSDPGAGLPNSWVKYRVPWALARTPTPICVFIGSRMADRWAGEF